MPKAAKALVIPFKRQMNGQSLGVFNVIFPQY